MCILFSTRKKLVNVFTYIRPRESGSISYNSVYLILAYADNFAVTETLNIFYRAMLCIRGTSHGPVSVCLSVSVSVCLSQVGVLLKRLNGGSHKQHHTIAQGLWFSDAKDLREIRPRSPPAGAPNAGGVGQNRRLSTNSWLYLENGTR